MLNVVIVLAASIGGWAITLTTWSAGTTPIAIGGLLLILVSQLRALGIAPPGVKQAVAIALMPGVHTPEQVATISKVTAPGVVPTPAVVKAILSDPATPPDPVVPPKVQ